MHIDVISDYQQFVGLKDRWDRLYEKDPEGQFFLSWIFFSTYLRRFEREWFILAVRPGPVGTPYVGFLPLRLRTKLNTKTGQFYNEIDLGGNYAADYTGILCDPQYADRAIPALAGYVKRMSWAKLHLENLRMSDTRQRLFLENLNHDSLVVRKLSRINKIDNVNNTKCPSVELQATFDQYLAASISPGTRQKIRRFLRRADTGPEFRITVADATTIDRDLEYLLKFWRQKWAERKGKRLEGIIRSSRRLYKDGFRSGTLFLPVLWLGDRPIAALATFLDPVKKSMLSHTAIRDETVEVPSAGRVLHAYSIRYGIERGYRTYEFLRGDEPYKYSFGATDTTINCLLVQTRTGRNIGDMLDPRSVETAFKRATKFHQDGQLAQAEVGYRQIVATAPRFGRAFYGLGQILADRGDHREAAKAYEIVTQVSPKAVKGWFRLGTEYQALDRHTDAADAFRKVLEIEPGLAAAEYALARSLGELKQTEEATAKLQALQEKLPANNPAGLALRLKAERQLKKLKQEEPRFILSNPAKAPPLAATMPEPGIVGTVHKLLVQAQSETKPAFKPFGQKKTQRSATV